MHRPSHPIILIPARLASTRLPDKPLADILGEPMIVHCWRRAMEADIGPVVVACGDVAIQDAIKQVGGRAVMTAADHPSGSDRIFEALGRVDPDARHDCIINLQGDLPTIDPALIRICLTALQTEGADISTLVAEITKAEEKTNPNVIKAVLALKDDTTVGRALYFSRATVPTGPGPLYHHIGLYAYTRSALARFVALPPGVLEQREKLEQLRALEAGMQIVCACVDTVPFGVDTPADLVVAREMIAAAGQTR
ncbi:MAG: 3-deoxy-manno-octulosonate cytidylyltransferase [Rhodospirillales bacterium]|nr:3-deoxy-manno-octulosonate cytidylyltransferase [Rhodospirillales bacterium]